MPRYIIIARDPLIASEAARAKLPSGVPATICFGRELSADEVFNQLTTQDLFEPQSAFYYMEFLELKLNKADGERVSEALARMPAETVLVLSQVVNAEFKSEEERILKGEAFQRFADGAQVSDLRKLSDPGQAEAWLRRRASEVFGLVMNDAQARRLLGLSNDSAALADAQLRKLALFKQTDQPQPLTDALLDRAVSSDPATRMQEIVDGIMLGKPAIGREIESWHKQDPEAFRLISELRRRLLGLRDLERGMSVQPPFFASQIRPLLGRWSRARINRAILRLTELEHGLKSGAYIAESSKDAELQALQVFARDVAPEA